MAIKGDYIWDPAKYPVGGTPSAYTPGTGAATVPPVDWDERVAIRWAEMLGYTPQTFKPIVAASSLTDDDKQDLLRPGFYPKMVSGALTKMDEGMFPNIINHRGEFRSPDGVLGLPERNEFGGESQSITDPAVL